MTARSMGSEHTWVVWLCTEILVPNVFFWSGIMTHQLLLGSKGQNSDLPCRNPEFETFVFQGAFVGYIVGTTVGIWLGVGNVIHGNRFAGLLPLSVDACPVDPAWNMSSAPLEAMTVTFATTESTAISFDNSTFAPLPTNPVQPR